MDKIAGGNEEKGGREQREARTNSQENRRGERKVSSFFYQCPYFMIKVLSP